MTSHILTFRAAQASDMAFLLNLRADTMNVHLAAVAGAIDQQAHVAHILFHFDAAQIVSIKQQAVALLKAYSDEQQWHLVQVQVAPDYQGKGLGSQLVKKIMHQAGTEQKKVSLRVLTFNPAKALYERLGFTVIAQTDIDYEMIFDPQG
jgi:ribosomal protein S18 acetylase RimI-like enzyme